MPAEKVTAQNAQVQGNFREATQLQAWDEEHKLLNGVLVVRGPSDQMLIMYVATHEIPQEAAGKILQQLSGGFTVLLQAKDDERMLAAKARGPQALMDMVSPAPKSAELWEKQYFLISSGKEPYGYVVVSETAEERNKKPGLALKTERWMFWPQGGGAEYESQKAFASWDLLDDEWSSRTETVVETQGQPIQMVRSDHSVPAARNLADGRDDRSADQGQARQASDPLPPLRDPAGMEVAGTAPAGTGRCQVD